MRILKLTSAAEKELLRARHDHDVGAERVAARIVGDIRRRGDSALFEWTKKLDGIDLRSEGVWISRREIASAAAQVDADFLRAVKHAAHNVRRVAEKQLPRPWTLEAQPGVTIGQVVRPIETIGCYIPGGRHALISTLVMTAVPATGLPPAACSTVSDLISPGSPSPLTAFAATSGCRAPRHAAVARTSKNCVEARRVMHSLSWSDRFGKF